MVITDSIDEKNLIGDLVAIEFTAHVPNTFNRMVVAFRAWLHRDLELHEGAPPERFLQHTRHVLKYTLFRFRELIRGRLTYAPDGQVVSTQDGSQPHCRSSCRPGSLDVALAVLQEKWSGDIRLKRPQFWLNGRDRAERAEICDEMAAAAINAGLLQGDRDTLPSTNRWGTCLEAGARLGAGIMFHDSVSASLVNGVGSWADGDAGEDYEEDFRRKARGKAWRAKHFCLDAKRKFIMCKTLWIASPLGHL